MFIIYLLLRLFTPNKKLLIWGDEARHLKTAKTFYKMWNNSFYDTHPPLYSWLIKQFSRFMADYKAGITISLLSSIGLYWICNRLYDYLGLNPYQKLIALGFITFNYTLIYYSNRIFRYQLTAFLGTLTLYLLLTKHALLGGLTWGLLSLTCSFAGLRMFWAWLFTGYNPIALIIFGLFYLGWLGEKMNIYANNTYYPSGLDGKIEPVWNFTFRQLISPMYFPNTYAYYGRKELGYDFKNWYKKIGGIFGLYWTKNLKLNRAMGALSLLSGCITILGMIKSPLFIVILTLLLLYPSLYKRFLPRNSIIAIPLLGYFLGKGFPIVNYNIIFGGVLTGIFGFLWFNRHWLYSKPIVQARGVSAYLQALPKDGILAEGLIAYSIAYLTDKRVVVIPHEPDKLMAREQVNLSMEEFDLNYAVFSDLYKTELHLGYPAIDYIKTFNLLTTIQEDKDIYYIYEKKNKN